MAACREAGALSFVNDRVDVALAADADGAHVGQVGSRPLSAPLMLCTQEQSLASLMVSKMLQEAGAACW